MTETGLTGVLDFIAQATSVAVALELACKVGGTEISIPKNPNLDSPLSKIVGLENALKITKEIGHGRLLIPMANMRGEAARRAKAAKLLDQGLSATEVARTVGIHERTVRRVRKRIKEDTLPLFD